MANARYRRTTPFDYMKWLSQGEEEVNWFAPIFVPDPDGEFVVEEAP